MFLMFSFFLWADSWVRGDTVLENGETLTLYEYVRDGWAEGSSLTFCIKGKRCKRISAPDRPDENMNYRGRQVLPFTGGYRRLSGICLVNWEEEGIEDQPMVCSLDY